MSPNHGAHFVREAGSGVMAYVAERPGWQVRVLDVSAGDDEQAARSLAAAAQWRPDAVITRDGLDHGRRDAMAALAPVSVATLYTGRGVSLKLDDEAVGAAAAGHLRSLGFPHYAVVGERDRSWSARRVHGFCEAIRGGGPSREIPTLLVGDYARSGRDGFWGDPSEELLTWLGGIRRPCGVFCTHDHAALEVASACEALGLHAPDSVAVVGANDDVYLCEASPITLSSVRLPFREIGYAAARCVDDMLAGREPVGQRRSRSYAPVGVTRRESSRSYPTLDERLSRATDFLRRSYRERIKVDDIASAAHVSRRMLEVLFRRHVGRSPHEELRRLRVEEACRLLRETTRKGSDIARSTQISEQHFSAAVREFTGMTPSGYRVAHAEAAPGPTARDA